MISWKKKCPTFELFVKLRQKIGKAGRREKEDGRGIMKEKRFFFGLLSKEKDNTNQLLLGLKRKKKLIFVFKFLFLAKKQ